jgi:hypothetical protein
VVALSPDDGNGKPREMGTWELAERHSIANQATGGQASGRQMCRAGVDRLNVLATQPDAHDIAATRVVLPALATAGRARADRRR